MTTVHVFDIDTTIANNEERAKLLERTCIVCLAPKPSQHRAPCPTCGKETRSQIDQSMWDKFFDPDMVINDTVQPKALEYANMLRARDVDIHFLTGRSEPIRECTKLWLCTKFGMQPSEELIMRPEAEDGLNAATYKERALHRLCVDKGYKKGTLFYFYEDDPHVFGMYAKHGIVVRCPEAFQYLVPDGIEVDPSTFAHLDD